MRPGCACALGGLGTGAKPGGACALGGRVCGARNRMPRGGAGGRSAPAHSGSGRGLGEKPNAEGRGGRPVCACALRGRVGRGEKPNAERRGVRPSCACALADRGWEQGGRLACGCALGGRGRGGRRPARKELARDRGGRWAWQRRGPRAPCLWAPVGECCLVRGRRPSGGWRGRAGFSAAPPSREAVLPGPPPARAC